MTVKQLIGLRVIAERLQLRYLICHTGTCTIHCRRAIFLGGGNIVFLAGFPRNPVFSRHPKG